MTARRFIEPVDVLYLRGNRLFGEPGDHSFALMPPWPSLHAGALRSRILVDRDISFEAFKAGQVDDPIVKRVLGTPDRPGTFTLTEALLARRPEAGNNREVYFQLPADLLVVEQSPGDKQVVPLELLAREEVLPAGTSGVLPFLAKPRLAEGCKPEQGCWLNSAGIAAYVQGRPLDASAHLVRSDRLWKSDSRLGIALDHRRRSAESGRLYTTEAIAPKTGIGFLVEIRGADDVLPDSGLLRFGGDGRAARIRGWEDSQSPWTQATVEDVFKIVLSSPGIFPGGWVPPGFKPQGDSFELRSRGLRLRLLAAAVNRFGTVSGWDLANHRPKPAQRVVPSGSVYWVERLEGDLDVLKEIQAEGLWGLLDDPGDLDAARRAEGFNRFWLAAAGTAAQVDEEV